MEDFLNSFWKKFTFIYTTTKELYILSEEYDDELSSFIQPIKEQRDALEHIVRAYSRMPGGVLVLSEDDQEYICKNLNKAIGHIFRAFFDCADVLSISLREKLSQQLKNFSYLQIVTVWPEYENERIKLIDMPKKIAKMRQKKDIAKDEDIIPMVNEYKESLNSLFDIYDTFMKRVYPKLNM